VSKSIGPSLPIYNNNMAAQNALAKSATIKCISEEASDSSSRSAHPSDSESSHDSSDSDSLDSSASRKRRKTSPTKDHAPPIHLTSTPSRIKSKIQGNAIHKQANNGAILAPTDPQATFASLNVKPWLVGSLSAMAIKRPTGIQKGCIPEILKGRDCIGGSRTGSGKTIAFAVPILQKWAEDPFGIFALVLTPTRCVCVTSRKYSLTNLLF
jgi:ATP-dependent RNA helicase DDX49/DBP8